MASKESQAVVEHWRRSALELRNGEQGDDERWSDLTKEPCGVDYVETDAGGVPAMWATPKDALEDRVLLAVHGGGYVSGSIYTHRKLFGHLAKAAGVRALVIDYRRLPEHTHPIPVDDTVAAYRWLLDQGIDAGRVVFTGDSAGGGMSVTAQLRARELGLPLPAAAMPFSPWVDMEATGESYETNREKDAFFSADLVKSLAAGYLGTAGDPRDPIASPLYADLTGLPPMYIQVGGDEVLLDDARRLHQHALTCGVTARLDVFPEQQHTFQMAAGRAPEADDAIRRMAEWIRPLLELPTDG